MDAFEETNYKLYCHSNFFSEWTSKYGKVALSREFYLSSFNRGFSINNNNNNNNNEKQELVAYLPKMEEDGYILSASGNKVSIAKNLSRDSYMFLSIRDCVYGPFGYYSKIKTNAKPSEERISVLRNDAKFKRLNLLSFMKLYRITRKDILFWSGNSDVEWSLDQELKRCKIMESNLLFNSKLINKKSSKGGGASSSITQNWYHQLHHHHLSTSFFSAHPLWRKEDDYYSFLNIVEISRFLCLCIENLNGHIDERDDIRYKIITQRMFYIQPNMSKDKKRNILTLFADKIDKMSEKDYYNTSSRNMVDTWSSARKVIISSGSYAYYSVRMLHSFYKKFFCMFETSHDKDAGLNISFSCLTVIAPYATYDQETEIINWIERNARTGGGNDRLFFNGTYLCNISSSLDINHIIREVKKIYEFASIYTISKPSSLKGTYISTYGGRILRYELLEHENFISSGGREWSGIFICPNMSHEKHYLGGKNPITHPSLFLGLAASLIPLINHNAGPRGIFMTNMIKQTLDPEDINIRRTHSIVTKTWNRRDPVYIRTLTTEALMRSNYGMNMLVKWACHYGYNTEDGIVINNRNITAGVDGKYIKKFTIKVEENKREFFVCLVTDFGVSNRFDENGVILEGQMVDDGDILATKVRIEDGGIVKKHYLKANLDNISKVLWVNYHDGGNTVDITVEYQYSLQIGDKMVSNSAQKGVITHIVDQSSEKADLIINPCCIPSRMTLAQIIEGVATNLLVFEKDIFSSTCSSDSILSVSHYHHPPSIFMPPFEEGLINKLVDRFNRIRGTSHKSIFDLIPDSGYWYCYNRYFVLGQRVDEKYRIRGGNTQSNIDRRTGQPTKGRKNQGGLRIGIMEKDVILSNRASSLLDALFVTHSDGITVYICPSCQVPTSSANSICPHCQIPSQAQQKNKSLINFEYKIKSMGLFCEHTTALNHQNLI